MRPRSVVFLPIIGMIGFMNVARNPRFEAIHTVDVLQLLVSGLCVGIALGALVAARRGAGGPADRS